MIGFFYYALYLPVITVLSYLLIGFPKVRERFAFERKNLHERGAVSFKASGEVADLCFEFSSEGEFQQVASLVEDALALGKKIELVFFSPSVEKGVLEWAQRFPAQIRYLRYPFLTSLHHSFSSWVTAPTLVLVRYDLFPEFLHWAQVPGRSLKMLSVTFKRERLNSKSISLVKRLFLKQSKALFFASEADSEFARSKGFKGETYDFRMEQIRRRMAKRSEKFQNLFPQYPKLLTLLEEYPRQRRLIIGNAWADDLRLLGDVGADVVVVVVPHQLSPEILEQFHQGLKKLRGSVQEINQSTTDLSGTTFILNKKGVLCELYADFGRAYVGGGLSTSVHSILEPLVAGADLLSCGPVHHRSTEYDVALSLDKVQEVSSSKEFRHWLERPAAETEASEVLSLIEAYPQHRKEVLSC